MIGAIRRKILKLKFNAVHKTSQAALRPLMQLFESRMKLVIRVHT